MMQPQLPGTKPHYLVLDGLRGVAAIMVVIFHIFEAHSPGPLFQIINHGYLAVDFFFLLSGYVIGYAYDDRWGKMNYSKFFKRRLIRLQPMVIAGAITGAALFYFQKSDVMWPGMGDTPGWKVLLLLVLGSLMLPVTHHLDIRAWGEMYPLNGPAWSLFFEYIANILYALIVRRLSKAALWILVVLAAALLVHYTVTGTRGDVIGGWSLEPAQLRIGFTRLLFPFFAGLLLCRITKPIQISNAFLWCSLLLILALSLPRFGGSEKLWLNGLYESMVIIFIFPLIVLLGAGATLNNSSAKRLCNFFGDISYPIYITHYPIIYLYTGWVVDNKPTPLHALPYGIMVLASSIILAYAWLKLYDIPIRDWMSKRWLQKKSSD
jgi:peptidoglycan/LPS O-acetylase OafA/YrhL